MLLIDDGCYFGVLGFIKLLELKIRIKNIGIQKIEKYNHILFSFLQIFEFIS